MKNKSKTIFVIVSLTAITGMTLFIEKNIKYNNMNYSFYSTNFKESEDIDISENSIEETTLTTEEIITYYIPSDDEKIAKIREKPGYKAPLILKNEEIVEFYNVNTDEIKELEKSIDKLKITTTEETKAGNFIIKKVNYILNPEEINYEIDEHNYRILESININYPQVNGVENKEMENKINKLLKYITVRLIIPDEPYYYKALPKIKEMAELDSDEKINEFLESGFYPYIVCVNYNYKMSVIDERYLSILYEGDDFYGRIVNSRFSAITIDMETGERVYLEDYADINSITNAIGEGKFEDYHGANFGPGGISKNVQSQTYPEAITAQISKHEEEIKEDKYYSWNPNNFYMDEGYVYVKFIFNEDYSLDGTIVLKIKKEDII